VENKRLGATLQKIADQQRIRDAQRLADPKITIRTKKRIRETAGLAA